MIIEDKTKPDYARVSKGALSVDLGSRDLVIRLGVHEYALAFIALFVWAFVRFYS